MGADPSAVRTVRTSDGRRRGGPSPLYLLHPLGIEAKDGACPQPALLGEPYILKRNPSTIFRHLRQGGGDVGITSVAGGRIGIKIRGSGWGVMLITKARGRLFLSGTIFIDTGSGSRIR